MDQEYSEGEKVKKGTKVDIVVSKGEPEVTPEPEEPIQVPEDEPVDDPTEDNPEGQDDESDGESDEDNGSIEDGGSQTGEPVENE